MVHLGSGLGFELRERKPGPPGEAENGLSLGMRT